MKVILIPSVDGGIGHIARTATLARKLVELDPTLTIEYLLDTERLRPFNIDVARQTGLRVTLLPALSRESREAIVQHALGDADVIVDDTVRYLIPLRQLVPQAAWISIPMYPLGDELFMDWPFLVQTDGIIWAYPPVVDFPPELAMLESKVVRTGPFLEVDAVPDRAGARTQLGFNDDEEIVLYAPRGMPFGLDFGQRVLASIIGALETLRAERPRLRLVLLAVRTRDELRVPGVPADLPGWISVVDVVPPSESLVYLRAADIAVTEGTSTTHEAAALGTPIVMVPGPIREPWVLGTRLGEHEAARILWIEQVTADVVADTFHEILSSNAHRTAMTQRARELVIGGGGAGAAARLVLAVAGERASRSS